VQVSQLPDTRPAWLISHGGFLPLGATSPLRLGQARLEHGIGRPPAHGPALVGPVGVVKDQVCVQVHLHLVQHLVRRGCATAASSP
jgi:hypothetical protein